MYKHFRRVSTRHAEFAHFSTPFIIFSQKAEIIIPSSKKFRHFMWKSWIFTCFFF